jgi:tetratricopeptide (TPR) repeat protein
MLLGAEAPEAGRVTESRTHLQRSLALYEAVGDRQGMGMAMSKLGTLAMATGALDEAERILEASLAIGRETENPGRVCFSLGFLCYLALQQAQPDRLDHAVTENLSFAHGAGTRGLGYFVYVLFGCGKYPEAHDLLNEIVAARGGRSGKGTTLFRVWLGFTQANLGRYGEARASAQTALALSDRSGHPQDRAASLSLLGAVGLAEEDYLAARGALAESVDLYQRNGMPGVVPQAILACVEIGLGHNDEALVQLREALRVESERPFKFWNPGYILPACALLLACVGRTDRAVELHALALRLPGIARSRWFQDVIGRPIAAAAEGLPPHVVEAARQRGRAHNLWDTLDALLSELEAP